MGANVRKEINIACIQLVERRKGTGRSVPHEKKTMQEDCPLSSPTPPAANQLPAQSLQKAQLTALFLFDSSFVIL